MSAASSTILVVLLLIVCFGSRRWALLAMMAGVFFLTQGHSVDVVGLSLYPVRFVEAAAFGRVVIRRELSRSRLNRIDWTLLLLYNYAALVAIARSSDVAPRDFANALDPTLCYLGLRGLFESIEDLRWLLRVLAVLLVPYTALVIVERLSGQTAFGFVGGSWELFVRDGLPRCQGSFRSSIILGSVAASFLSLYIGMASASGRRGVPMLGAALCLILVILSRSGGPVASAGAALLGWSLWFLRDRMRLVRWSAVGGFLLLALVMKAPIWYLPFKVSGFVGGSGYHRGLLMEQAWRDLSKWWLFGMDVGGTADWMPYQHGLFVGADITNQFVVFALRGGLLALVLSVIVLLLAFKALGSALGAMRRSGQPERSQELLLWGLGVALLVHAVSWLGISYFDQSYVIWLMHLAAVSASTQALAAEAGARVPAVKPARARSSVLLDIVSLRDGLAAARAGQSRSSGRKQSARLVGRLGRAEGRATRGASE